MRMEIERLAKINNDLLFAALFYVFQYGKDNLLDEKKVLALKKINLSDKAFTEERIKRIDLAIEISKLSIDDFIIVCNKVFKKYDCKSIER